LRCAYIAACWDLRPKLRVADLGPALALAKYQSKVRTYLAPNPGLTLDAKCCHAIRTYLNDHHGQWVNRRVLYRVIHAERFGPGVFNMALKNMQLNGELELHAQGVLLSV
jgi:hypothetical protein